MHVAAYERARALIDEAHSADPARAPDGRPAELVYADRVEAWVVKLDPENSADLRLAARCQHLERWLTPRNTFPEGKVGYLNWRRSLYVKQAERAKELLLAAGLSTASAENVRTWVSKTALKTNPGSQMLEDAAVLVFLENEIGAFAAQHADYTREKFVDILRKTWKKLSPAGQQAALGLDLPPAIAELVREALAATATPPAQPPPPSDKTPPTGRFGLVSPYGFTPRKVQTSSRPVPERDSTLSEPAEMRARLFFILRALSIPVAAIAFFVALVRPGSTTAMIVGALAAATGLALHLTRARWGAKDVASEIAKNPFKPKRIKLGRNDNFIG